MDVCKVERNKYEGNSYVVRCRPVRSLCRCLGRFLCRLCRSLTGLDGRSGCLLGSLNGFLCGLDRSLSGGSGRLLDGLFTTLHRLNSQNLPVSGFHGLAGRIRRAMTDTIRRFFTSLLFRQVCFALFCAGPVLPSTGSTLLRACTVLFCISFTLFKMLLCLGNVLPGRLNTFAALLVNLVDGFISDCFRTAQSVLIVPLTVSFVLISGIGVHLLSGRNHQLCNNDHSAIGAAVFTGGKGNQLIAVLSGYARVIQGQRFALCDKLAKGCFILRIDKMIIASPISGSRKLLTAEVTGRMLVVQHPAIHIPLTTPQQV